MAACINLSELPEGCLSHILSLTTPKDVLRSSAVSKQFLSASESDTVWETFLPCDIDQILSQSCSTLPQLDTKKDLYLFLCRSPLLLDDKSQSFALDKGSGKKCYMISARSLTITWMCTPQYWILKPVTYSRFPEVAELKNVCWLLIKGKIHIKLLSPGTTYGAYFVFKMKQDGRSGFENTPVKVFVSEIDADDELPRNYHPARNFYLKESEQRTNSWRSRRNERAPGELPVNRDDGWKEIEMGQYRVSGADSNYEVLEMTLSEIEVMNWKSGLIVQGIELRPLL